MASKKRGKFEEISFKEVYKEVDNGLAGADRERLQGLAGLNRLRKAKSGALDREKKRLLKKLGPNDPRVKKLELKEKSNQSLIHNLDQETERARTDVSNFDENAWNLFGYVRDSSGSPRGNLTVSLLDPKGQRPRQFDYGCTDKRGFFSIIHPRKEKTGKESPEVKQQLFIQITDKNRNVLYKDPGPLFFEIGKVDYREIYLPEEGSQCTPPEPPGKPGQSGEPTQTRPHKQKGVGTTVLEIPIVKEEKGKK